MTTRTRRMIGAVAAGTLALALAACSSDSTDEDAVDGIDAEELDGLRVGAMDEFGVGDTFTATEPVEFSLLYRDHPNYPLDTDWLVIEEITERNNVTFDFTTAPLSDWEQRRSLLIGAGDAPNLIPVTYPGEEEQYVASGAILAVSDYLELMPNLSAKIEEWELEPEFDELRQEDGKFYLLPGILQSPRPDYTIGMRMDVLDELGLEAPTTWDEFREVLEAIKADRGGAYVFSDRWQGNALLQASAASFGTVGGWGLTASDWDPEAEEFVFPAATDEYRAMVEFYAGLVADGLMDPESFTQEDDPAFQKLANEQSYVITTNAQELPILRTALDATVGQGEYDIRKIRLPAGPAGDVIGNSRLQSGLMISSAAAESENFVAMMQFVDWLYYSDEGLEFSRWGVEGQTFEREGDERVLAADVDWTGLNPEASTDLRTDYGFMNGVFMLEHGSSDDLTRTLIDDEEVAWQEEMADKEQREVPPPAPLDELEREQASLNETALLDFAEQNTLAFITGQRDLSEWDSYISELEGQNLSSYLQVINEAHQRYLDTQES